MVPRMFRWKSIFSHKITIFIFHFQIQLISPTKDSNKIRIWWEYVGNPTSPNLRNIIHNITLQMISSTLIPRYIWLVYIIGFFFRGSDLVLPLFFNAAISNCKQLVKFKEHQYTCFYVFAAFVTKHGDGGKTVLSNLQRLFAFNPAPVERRRSAFSRLSSALGRAAGKMI